MGLDLQNIRTLIYRRSVLTEALLSFLHPRIVLTGISTTLAFRLTRHHETQLTAESHIILRPSVGNSQRRVRCRQGFQGKFHLG